MDAQGYVDCGDNRDEIVFPWLREILAAKRPAAVLDFGCGDARFALQVERLVGARVTACERDASMREQARRRIATENRAVTLCGAPEDGWAGAFDVVFLQGVWMCWSTRAECVDTLRTLARALRPDGVLIASVTHPCFRDRRFATYRTDFAMEHYLENGTPFQVFVGRPGAEVAITDTHWNLEDMFNQALEAGLMPCRLKEHADGAAGVKNGAEGADGRPSWLSVVFSPLPRGAASA